MVFSCAATAYERQHELIKKRAALDGAIRCRKAAIDLSPNKDWAVRSGWLTLLGVSLLQRYDRDRNLDDLNAAIEAHDQVRTASVELDAKDISRFGNARESRFHHTGSVEDLNCAVALHSEAADRARAEGRPSPEYAANVASALWARAEYTGEISDYDRAVEEARSVVAAAEQQDDPHLYQHLATLATILSSRFDRLGSLADLDDAIAYDRQALDVLPAPEIDIAQMLNGLAADLRKGGAGDLADVLSPEEPVEHVREHPALPGLLSHLGSDLAARFRISGDSQDLDEAITKHREAVEATPSGDPDRLRCLTNLATALATRAQILNDANDANEAVKVAQAAADAAPHGHPMRPRALSNLAIALARRYEHTRDPAELDHAVSIARDSVRECTDLDRADRARFLLTLGHVLRVRSELEGEHTLPDWEDALRSWQEAAELTAAPAAIRAMAARSSADALSTRGKHDQALRWYTRTVELLPLVAWRGIGRKSQERQLAVWTSLANNAAACAINAGRPMEALQLLEQGRSVLWSQLLETRTDLTDLRSVNKDLAMELENVRAGLDRDPELTALDQTPLNKRPAEDHRMAQAMEWDTLVEEVRKLPGFASFLRPPPATDLYRAAADGTAVVINISQERCDAIAVTTSGAELIRLPELTLESAMTKANDYLQAIQHYESAQTQLALTQRPQADDPPSAFHQYTSTKLKLRATRDAMEQLLQETLEWAWDVIAEPVLTHLGFLTTPGEQDQWPRVWWCPTGPLTVVPLHAAGYHAPGAPSGQTVLDRAISSYTPTLRALYQARSSSPATVGTRPQQRMLVVAMPNTPNLAPLPNVERERDLLTHEFFPGRSTVMHGHQATREAVRAALGSHRWVHFSCHGMQDLAEPSFGGLYLYDRPLSLTDISAGQFHGEFAYLSACKTAIGGVHLPDEAITLAAALHYTGYSHVIATLWSVYDPAAADVSEALYRRLTTNGHFTPEHAATALHHTIRQLRERYRTEPSVWIPFTHTGP